MRIIGYGICGEGEAKRYMRQTLESFERLCDEVVILCNNASQAEKDLIDEFGFKRFSDRREWGKWQWKIKQDFLERDIAPIASPGDMMLCLDMDEVFDKNLTREWILSAELDAYHLFIVDLWGEGWKPESCFWNVRMWRWNGETAFKQKPVHCGLAPQWAYHYHRFAPFILKHYGLKEKEDRLRRVERYKIYDPDAKHLDKKYYDMLMDESFKPFDEDSVHDTVEKEVATYKQTKPQNQMTQKKQERFAYVENPHGNTIDIPEKHLAETLKRQGFKFVGWADDVQKEIEELFEEVDIGEENDLDDGVLGNTVDASQGSYQGTTAAIERQFQEMENGPQKEEELSETSLTYSSKKPGPKKGAKKK